MLSIAKKLDQLANLYSEKDLLQEQKRKLIESVVPIEILKRIDEIDSEFTQNEEAALENINTLEQEIKNETLAYGETVKTSGYIAVWNQGRISWDNKELSTFAEIHPEILPYRKEGQPSVTIKRTQEKDPEK